VPAVFHLRRIVCPTDFSPCAAAAVDYAAGLARACNAKLLLLHVVPEFDQYVLASPDAVVALPELMESTRRRANAELEKLRRGLAGIEVRTEIREGSVHESILAATKQADADLIVLGTHGRTGLKHFVLGSIAGRIVRLAPVPVLTVREPA
jgi:nucleotide-binding universal stress UspA family protein